MAITSNEKEAIDIVVSIIDRRIAWLKENEPQATKEIESNWNASSLVLELKHLNLNNE